MTPDKCPTCGASWPSSASPSSPSQPSSADGACSEGGAGSQLRPSVEVTRDSVWEEAIVSILLEELSDPLTDGIALPEWRARYIASCVVFRVQHQRAAAT